MRILKYELEIVEEQSVNTYTSFKILDVQLQYNKIVLWALVDETSEPFERNFAIYDTGAEVDARDIYIGTVQTHLVKGAHHIFTTHSKSRG